MRTVGGSLRGASGIPRRPCEGAALCDGQSRIDPAWNPILISEVKHAVIGVMRRFATCVGALPALESARRYERGVLSAGMGNHRDAFSAAGLAGGYHECLPEFSR